MAFDMGFNCRATAGYVTDPAYGVPLLGESYPHTYTNGNGDSINAGWNPINGSSSDLINTNDPRLAGQNYCTPSNESIFQVDLSSGSAPGAGSYIIDVAVGQNGTGFTQQYAVKDNTTTLIAVGPTAIAAGHYFDATGADVTASTTWTGTTVSKTFATTTVYWILNPGGTNADFSTGAHFRLTLATASAFPWTYYATQMSA